MTECYACAKLAELMAENNALRGIASELREDVAESDDVIAVLKAENAELQSRHCEWSDPDSLGDGCMLRKDKRVDELTAERDELRREVDRLTRENARLSDDEFYLRCTLVDMNGEVVS